MVRIDPLRFIVSVSDSLFIILLCTFAVNTFFNFFQIFSINDSWLQVLTDIRLLRSGYPAISFKKRARAGELFSTT
jgi:hypothetical protein